MTLSEEYEPTAVDFSGSQFTVEQTGRDKNFQPEYVARTVSGDTLFSVTYQMYEEKDEFPFVDADGNEIFSVKASGTWDIAGDYRNCEAKTHGFSRHQKSKISDCPPDAVWRRGMKPTTGNQTTRQ